jgi:pseudouridine-5'-phosphate glycosidase
MRFTPSDEVGRALASGAPVVALESSLIAHGFPAPDNLAIGRALEAAVRDEGAVPATIGVIGGEVRVGLSVEELARLAVGGAAKCATRDIAPLCAAGADGGTTVAATVRIAAAAGIAILATGGIGGVHRGWAQSHDVSADVVELGRCGVAVVCAGAKALLDLAATLEALETQGVAVVGFGCSEFPAFYSADSGLALAHAVDDVAALTRLLSVQRALAPASGLVICQPPPAAAALGGQEVEALVETALAEAAARGVSGGALTPYVLGALDRPQADQPIALERRALGFRDRPGR